MLCYRWKGRVQCVENATIKIESVVQSKLHAVQASLWWNAIMGSNASHRWEVQQKKTQRCFLVPNKNSSENHRVTRHGLLQRLKEDEETIRLHHFTDLYSQLQRDSIFFLGSNFHFNITFHHTKPRAMSRLSREHLGPQNFRPS